MGNRGDVEEDPAAEVDVAFESDRREVGANPQLVLQGDVGAQRHAPTNRFTVDSVKTRAGAD